MISYMNSFDKPQKTWKMLQKFVKNTLGIHVAHPTLNVKETLYQVEYTFDLCVVEM